MAFDSQTATATTSEKPLEENKVNEEAKLMEKENVLPETMDVVKDEPVSDSNLTVTKEEKNVQIPAGEPEKEPPADVEEVKEPTLVKEGVEEVNIQAVDGKEEEKQILESVAEEDKKDKEETKVVEASESTYEPKGKHMEQVDVQYVSEVPEENVEDKIKDVEVLEVETKPEASEKVETQAEKAKEMAPEVEVVKTEETPETTEQAKVEQPKEVAVKQKHSNSIMSKVKQSLVKAKKAIIGKSQSSKTISTEEIKV